VDKRHGKGQRSPTRIRIPEQKEAHKMNMSNVDLDAKGKKELAKTISKNRQGRATNKVSYSQTT
jgi:hypothetical protein